jgi:hypothetical protein
MYKEYLIILIAVGFTAILSSLATAPASPGDLGTESYAAISDMTDTCATWDDSAILAGLHPVVQEKVVYLRHKMARLGRRVYLMSGARPGQASASMHTQSLAVDVTIDYLNSKEVAEELRQLGFTCVIAYFDRSNHPCHMAHGDLRGTAFAKGGYALGGRKALNCPENAISRSDSCDNAQKSQWSYTDYQRKPRKGIANSEQTE